MIEDTPDFHVHILEQVVVDKETRATEYCTGDFWFDDKLQAINLAMRSLRKGAMVTYREAGESIFCSEGLPILNAKKYLRVLKEQHKFFSPKPETKRQRKDVVMKNEDAPVQTGLSVVPQPEPEDNRVYPAEVCDAETALLPPEEITPDKIRMVLQGQSLPTLVTTLEKANEALEYVRQVNAIADIDVAEQIVFTVHQFIKGKIDNTAFFLDAVDAEIEALEKAYKYRKKQLETIKDGVKEVVKRVVDATPDKRIDGVLFSAAIVNNGGMAAIQFNDELIPDEYKEYSFSIRIKKEEEQYWQSCYFKRRIKDNPLTVEEQILWSSLLTEKIPVGKDSLLRKDAEAGKVIPGVSEVKRGTRISFTKCKRITTRFSKKIGDK